MKKSTITETNEIFNDYSEKHLKQFNNYESDIVPKAFNCLEKITNAVHSDKKILIYGDYDVDGISSTVFLYEMIRDFGIFSGDNEIAKRIDFEIPSRQEGYGLSSRLLEAYVDTYDYIFTLDNGTHEEFYKSIKGNKSITDKIFIIDHHPNGDFKDTDFILNPNDGDFEISTGYLLDYIYRVLLMLNPDYAKESSPTRYSDLAAMTLISDMANLNNTRVRDIISDGLNVMKEKKRFLYQKLFIRTNKEINYSDIAFKINPMVNTVGRLSSKPKLIAKMLTFTKFSREANEFYNALNEMNELRKTFLNEYTNKAIEETKANNSKVIHYHNKDIPVGLNGLIANKIQEIKKVPAIVTSYNIYSQSVLGSGRGEGVKEILNKISNPEVFTYGGHSAALGVKVKNLKEFDSLLSNYDQEVNRTKDIKEIPGENSLNSFIELSKELTQETKGIPFADDFYIKLENIEVTIAAEYRNNFCKATIRDKKDENIKIEVLLNTSTVKDYLENEESIDFKLKLFNEYDFERHNDQNYTSELILTEKEIARPLEIKIEKDVHEEESEIIYQNIG